MQNRSLSDFSTIAQRDWVWRGWRIRYSFIRAAEVNEFSLPIVLLHGFGASSTQWAANLSVLSQHHTVYALDFLGFGASEKAATSYRLQLWAEQVYEFWRSFIGQPIALIGHSLGSVVALMAASAHPEMIRGLAMLTLPLDREEVIAEPVFAVASTVERLFANPLVLGPAFRILRQPRVLRTVLKTAYANPTFVTEELVASFAQPALERGSEKVFFRLAKGRTLPDYSPNIRPLLAQLQRPMLLLWGQQDRIVPIAQSKKLPALNPDLQLVELPNAGHCLYDECAERVNLELLNWIETRLV
jgi:pimeloyl-ACP methyl ester carboxylesterase